MKKSLYTVWVFTKLNTQRFFRDKLAIFFGIAFPVIFLLIFGFIFNNDSSISFRVALINRSDSEIAQNVAAQIRASDIFEVEGGMDTLRQADEAMSRSQLDGTIILPETYGETSGENPSGQLQVRFTQNNNQAGQALASILEQQLDGLNAQFVEVEQPFTVVSEKSNARSLSQFDYTFAGLLGFAIIGLGIFSPVNVFPELKKLGVLRRLRTTPLRVWQFFVSTMIAQAFIGLVALAILYAIAITVFDLNVVGNFLEIGLFTILSIVAILGIGLAIGGWAQNERQAQPIAQLVVFPLLFLSGTFFPRFIMPDWLQNISEFLPLTPVIDGLRLLTTEGLHLIDILPQIGLLAAWILVVYALAFRIFRWE